ncbi:VOC family protein [Gorillibacterium sp. sgz5001074]|uniref:VOC family protein n=1 Tax=Gorillibacterium sp. sgz5001074 TaxID=3446695 RepID=UPI003F66C36A
MELQVRQTFINVPVKDLNRTIAFFKEIGFSFNAQFTNETAACMIINETTSAMLLTEDFFKGFSKKDIPDTVGASEVIVALQVNTKEEVDTLADKAIAAGAKPYNDPSDHGFMYTRNFQDPDHHLWEIFWMDPNAAPPQD